MVYIFILNIVILTIMFFIFKRFIKKNLLGDAHLDELRKEFNELLTEINYTTEKNIEVIEEKISELKNTEKNITKKIKMLSEESSLKNSNFALYSEIGLKKSPLKELVKEKKELDIQIDDSSNFDKAKKMYRDGIENSEIAKKLNISIEEVDLICTNIKKK